MDWLKRALPGAILMLTAANAIAAPAASTYWNPSLVNQGLFEQRQCTSNCVLSLRSVSNLIVVARDSKGAIFKTLSFAMPTDARLLAAGNAAGVTQAGEYRAGQMAGASTGDASNECISVPGVCTASNVRSYVTPSFYIFYTYTYVFRDGNLLEISVEETRIARNMIN